MKINFETFVPKFDEFVSRGLSNGIGTRDGQMCIEAAVCAALGLEHSDDPGCVTTSIRRYKIALNDSTWSSPEARAKGLRDLGIAQVGSLGVVDDGEFSKLLVERTIRILIPALFRDIFPTNSTCLAAADRCEKEGTAAAAYAAAAAAYAAAYAADAAADAAAADAAAAAAYAAAAADAAYAAAADAAAYAAAAAAYAAAAYTYADDKYLLLSAEIALSVLRDLKSPGCEWL